MAKSKGKRGRASRLLQMSQPERTLLDQAQALFHQGNMLGAEQALNATLALNPSNSLALQQLAGLAHQTGRLGDALGLYERALKINASDAALRCGQGEVLRAVGRTTDARQAFKQATRSAPDMPEAWGNLALTSIELGDAASAVKAAQRCVKLAPSALPSQMVCAEAWSAAGDPSAALAAYEKAWALDSQCYEAAFGAAASASAIGAFDKAKEWLTRAQPGMGDTLPWLLSVIDVELNARDPEAALSRVNALDEGLAGEPQIVLRHAQAMMALGRFAEAVVSYQRVLADAPLDADVRLQLAVAQVQSGDVLTGLATANEAAEQTERASDFVSVGRLCAMVGQSSEALNAFERAILLAPQDGDALRGRAEIAVAAGDFTAAKRDLRQVIANDAGDGYAMETLAQITRPNDWPTREWKALEKLARSKTGDPRLRASANFALGKLLDSDEQVDAAFEAYHKGNALMREVVAYDAGEHDRFVTRIIDAFGAFPTTPETRPPGMPIFIIGMPRSGTSLVEQIIASHSECVGAGEVEFFTEVSFGDEGRNGFPEQAKTLPEEMLASLRERYQTKAALMARLSADGSKPAFISDKMPSNFLYLGLIHQLFPNAAIIHCRRDPMDVGVSNYFQNFTSIEANAYSFGLADIGHFICAYERLMNHWHRVLPERILDIDYQMLVAEPELQIRRLLRHVGLAWEDGCLAFHQSGRDVRTASSYQVRQPLYNSSVERWRRYESHLGPLISALRDV